MTILRDSGHEIDLSVALFFLQVIMKSSLHSPLAAASREIYFDLPGSRVTMSLPKKCPIDHRNLPIYQHQTRLFHYLH
jgi:hypothetical protein